MAASTGVKSSRAWRPSPRAITTPRSSRPERPPATVLSCRPDHPSGRLTYGDRALREQPFERITGGPLLRNGFVGADQHCLGDRQFEGVGGFFVYHPLELRGIVDLE